MTVYDVLDKKKLPDGVAEWVQKTVKLGHEMRAKLEEIEETSSIPLHVNG